MRNIIARGKIVPARHASFHGAPGTSRMIAATRTVEMGSGETLDRVQFRAMFLRRVAGEFDKSVEVSGARWIGDKEVFGPSSEPLSSTIGRIITANPRTVEFLSPWDHLWELLAKV